MKNPDDIQDIWSRWLLHTRHGGDPQAHKRGLEMLKPIRDQILDHAALQPGETLLDVGCGDGLIAFGALERTAQSQVIFCDISQDLLEHTRSLADELGLTGRCRFVQAAAQDLSPLADGTAQALTTRSVLIYVEDKPAALDEFFRVLAPGGRLSIWEPINSFRYPPPEHVFMGYDLSSIRELVVKLRAAYRDQSAAKNAAEDPMINFDERDLLDMAEKAGFEELHLQFEAHIQPVPRPPSWQAFYQHAPNPLAPTLQELVESTLSAAEREAFTAVLRPLVENGQGRAARAGAYLWGLK